jgi:hypothetical protein
MLGRVDRLKQRKEQEMEEDYGRKQKGRKKNEERRTRTI